ncbi:MAG: hypothetical protein HYS18_05080 [Burkholderiales bacterium]|nr:hypothetical protein [Burkholderiales bacterium]
MKVLIWLAIAALIVAWVARSKKKSSQVSASRSAAARDSTRGEKMLQCRHCGVHFPASDAVLDANGAAFCSDEHRRRDP